MLLSWPMVVLDGFSFLWDCVIQDLEFGAAPSAVTIHEMFLKHHMHTRTHKLYKRRTC